MTIGISIDDLLKIDPWQYDNQQDVLNAILDKCTELNSWLPIDENTPKDRPILLFGSSIFKGRWSQIDNSWIEDGGLLRNPNQWTALPK